MKSINVFALLQSSFHLQCQVILAFGHLQYSTFHIEIVYVIILILLQKLFFNKTHTQRSKEDTCQPTTIDMV